MAEVSRARGTIKFIVWTAIAVGLIWYGMSTYHSGQMIRWYYYQASADGYAINADSFKNATKQDPAKLEIGPFETITGLQAVPVKKGDRLPENTNGVITNEVLKKAKRAKLEDKTLVVMMPVEIKEARGFKYKDRFKHKGVKTNPWSGVWNVAMILSLGVALGLMAEGFTDMLGFKVEKIKHFESVH
jgi:hypothetical protein